MGAIIAKFRKEKTTEEILENLEEKISEIQKFTINTQEQQRRFVGNFLAISIGVYVIAFIIFYFVYFPPTWKERGIYSVPLFLFPIVIFLLRKLFTWYFQRKLNKNSNRLKQLRGEKKKILEEVMDKEKYKVAVSLLERFGDKSYQSKLIMSTPKVSATPSASLAGVKTSSLGATPPMKGLPQSRFGAQNQTFSQLNSSKITSLALTPRAPNAAPRAPSLGPIYNQSRQVAMVTPGQELRRRPFPVFDWQNSNFLDRLFGVLANDGPKNRFAMICKECYSHNGMALEHDFEFTSFRCAFCNALNPARKKMQATPLLSGSFAADPQLTRQDSSDSASSKNSDEAKVNRLSDDWKPKEAGSEDELNPKEGDDESDDNDEKIPDLVNENLSEDADEQMEIDDSLLDLKESNVLRERKLETLATKEDEENLKCFEQQIHSAKIPLDL